jgi:lipoate---protein ligase
MRVLLDGPATGDQNMARDLALLADGVPTLRLYQWRPACVSLGLPQPESDIDVHAAHTLGIDIVRRPTGGGAILHAEDEITYSVVLPRALAPADLFASYRFMAQGVRNALRHLGLESEFMEGHTGRDPLCYLREEGVSVGVGGRKISGGAQKRTKTHLLQHGTLLVSSDLERNAQLFRLTPDRVAAHVTSLRDQGLQPATSDVRAALLRGFVEALRPLLEAEAPHAALPST